MHPRQHHSSCLAIPIIVLARNEARVIARCLESLPLSDPQFDIHVVVNGSQDATVANAQRVAARHHNITVHDWVVGGKARSWNRIVFEMLSPEVPLAIFVDGDCQVAAGSISALINTLDHHPDALIAAAMPLNGRHAEKYRLQMWESHGLWGDLYALRGCFLKSMRAANLRLPDDLVGEDGLIAALAKTDLGWLADWRDARVQPTMDAGFYCTPFNLGDVRSWWTQLRRMIAYAERHFQNQIITHILQNEGALGLPERLDFVYPRFLPEFKPRRGVWWPFDRYALAKMAHASIA